MIVTLNVLQIYAKLSMDGGLISENCDAVPE